MQTLVQMSRLTIAISLLSSCMPPKTHLPIVGEKQKEDEWCVPASMSTISKFWNRYPSEQCDIANKNLCRNDCCDDPKACDIPQVLRPQRYGYRSAVDSIDTRTEGELARELSSGRPALLIGQGGANHMVVASGYFKLPNDGYLVETWDPWRGEFGWRRITEKERGYEFTYLYSNLRPRRKGPSLRGCPNEMTGVSTNSGVLSTPELRTSEERSSSDDRTGKDTTHEVYGSEEEANNKVLAIVKELALERGTSVGFNPLPRENDAQPIDHVNSVAFVEDERRGACVNRSEAEPSASCRVKSRRFRFGSRIASGAFAYFIHEGSQRRLLAVEGVTLTSRYDRELESSDGDSVKDLVYLPGERAFFLKTKTGELVNLYPKGRFNLDRYDLQRPQPGNPQFDELRRLLKDNKIPLEVNPRPDRR